MAEPARRGPPENTNAQTHGAFSARTVSPLAAEIRADLLADVPRLASPSLRGAVDSLCWVEAQLRLLRDWLDQRQGGAIDGKGRLRSAAKLWSDLEARADSLRSKLRLYQPEPEARSGDLDDVIRDLREGDA